MNDAPSVLGPRAEVALTYWQGLRRGRTMPARADLDPAAIPKLLTSVLLVDVLRDPLDFRYRLVGSDIDAISHRNFRGVRFSEILHMRRGNRLWAQYQEVAKTGRPPWSEVPYVGADPFIRRMLHCLMPLGVDGKTVDMIFAVVDIERMAVAAA